VLAFGRAEQQGACSSPPVVAGKFGWGHHAIDRVGVQLRKGGAFIRFVEGKEQVALEELAELLGAGCSSAFFLAEHSVPVPVQIPEQPGDELFPAGLEGLTIEPDMQPQTDRPLLAKEDQVLDIAGPARRLGSRREQEEGKHEQEDCKLKIAN